MKKSLPYIFIFAALLAMVVFVIPLDVKVAAAQGLGGGPMPNPFKIMVGFGIDSAFQLVNVAIKSSGNLVLSLAGFVLWLAGAVLNFVVQITIVDLSENIKRLDMINSAWVRVRDLANILFIFFALYISIRTILGVSTGETKKLLIRMIIAALLINFSLFFTKVVIDGSNIAALHFYRLVPKTGSFAFGAGTKPGFSNTIMDRLSLTTIYDTTKGARGEIGAAFTQDFKQKVAAGFSETGTFFIATVGGSIFVLIAAFVFFVISLFLVTRFVAFLFLLALSPLAFATWILPNLKKLTDKWWLTLWNQALFAPAVMLLLWVAMELIPKVTEIIPGAEDSFSSLLFQVGASSIGVLLNYVFIIAIIIFCLVAAKSFGVYGSGMIIKGGQSARKWGQGALGRATVGQFGQRLDKRLKESRFGATYAGSKVRKIITTPMLEAKFGSAKSRKDILEARKTEKKEMTTIARAVGNKEIIKANLVAVPTPANHRAIADVLDKMSNKEIEALDVKELSHPIMLQHLDAEQFDYVVNRSEKSDKDKAEIKGARAKLLKDAVSGAIPMAADVAGRLVRNTKAQDLKKQIENDPTIANAGLVRHLRPSHLKTMEDLPDTTRQQIGTIIRNLNTAAAATGGHAAFNFIKTGGGRGIW